MNELTRQLQNARILPLLPSLVPPGQSLYLVGGAVRDALRGVVTRDYDFATAFDPTEMAQDFARQIAGTWFWLDPDRRQSRVVRKLTSGPIHYDFAPFRAESLDEDLRLRDFSLNAIAIEITSDGPSPQPIDPLDGQEALRRGELVACGPSSFDDDPLRILRGLRYALTLDAGIAPDTHDRMRAAVAQLSGVAAERIGAELIQAFGAYTFESFCRLVESLALETLVFGRMLQPHDRSAAIQACQHVHQQLQQLQKQRQGRAVRCVLDRQFQPGVDSRFILLLSAFAGAAKLGQASQYFAGQWRLGRKVIALIQDLQQVDPSQWKTFQRCASTDRAQAIWMESLGPNAEQILLWHLLFNPVSGRERSRALETLQQWPLMAPKGRVADLVSGHWIKQIRPSLKGIEIGHLQHRIKQAEMAGQIRSAAEAKAWLLADKH